MLDPNDSDGGQSDIIAMSMHLSVTKPCYEYQKHLSYLRHRDHLLSIQKTPVVPPSPAVMSTTRRMRTHSFAFHQQQNEERLTANNEGLLKRLQHISRRKRSLYEGELPPKMIRFDNPARKKRERLITEMNHQLAQRLVDQQSVFNPKNVRRDIRDYERIKQTLNNNKRTLQSSHFRYRTLASAEVRKSQGSSLSLQRNTCGRSIDCSRLRTEEG